MRGVHVVVTLVTLVTPGMTSDFAIKILGDLSDGDGYYRLDYRSDKQIPY